MYEAGGGGGGHSNNNIYLSQTSLYTIFVWLEGGGGSLKSDLACMFLKNEIFLVGGEESRGPRFDVIFVENLILNFLFCRINGVQNELCVDTNKYYVCFVGGGGGHLGDR